MKEINKQAVAEVVEILNHSENEIINRIPEKFIQFLHDNSDTEFHVNINFNSNDWDTSISQDTKAILALIYRDYIVSDEERIILLKKEHELSEKYNPNDLFKKDNNSIEDNNNNSINNKQLIEIKEEQWFKKFWKKIISFFGKK